MFCLTFTFFFIWGTCIESVPLGKEMVLSPEQEEFLSVTSSPINVWLWPKYYWKDAILFYKFGSGLSAWDQDLVQQAMANIEEQSCIRFQLSNNPRTPKVIIQRKDSGCWAHVGFRNKATQPLNLGAGCMSRGIIQHELLHALAFAHMHSDPNRDQFVKIVPQNIKKGYAHNFAKYRVKDVSDFDLGYDYDSLMHYGPTDFSKNGKPTVVALRSSADIGQRQGLSKKDVIKLNRVYCNMK